MGAASPPESRRLGFARGFGVRLGDEQGQDILGALDSRFCGLIGVVALAFETGMFSLSHIFNVEQKSEKSTEKNDERQFIG